MAIPKENVVDLRRSSAKKSSEAPARPANRKKRVLKNELDFDTFQVKPEVKITAIIIIGVLLVGLAAYFAISSNYLASGLFVLAGATLAIALSRKKNTTSKIQKPESLADIVSKIIGL